MAQLQKYGPYGAQTAAENFSFQIEGSDRITAVIVRSGFMVDAIGFTITGDNGVSRTTMYGGNGENDNKIELQLGEYLIGISGTAKDSMISKLRIHTTLKPEGHGPFGTKDLCNGFKSPMPLPANERIVGFFGSAQTNVASLGLCIEKKSQSVAKVGPFGNQTGRQWSIMLEDCENFKEIIIKTGAIVDSFMFVTTKTRQKFGGDGGNAEHKITLQAGEFITNVSGWIGEWHENRCLTKLKLHTNMRMDGYGPFGGGPYTNYLSEFRSQVPSGGRVVGFFGTLHKNYVESIGLYVKQ